MEFEAEKALAAALRDLQKLFVAGAVGQEMMARR